MILARNLLLFLAGLLVVGGAWSFNMPILAFIAGTIMSAVAVHDQARRFLPKRVNPPWDPQPRQLATTAQDEAAKAADLGLPTGVWTDLAATWTTWADQDDADKPTEAPEEPVKRPTPPAGGGGAGHVPWVVDAPPGSSQSHIMKLLEAVAKANTPTDWVRRKIPQACATNPVTDELDFGGGHYLVVPYNLDSTQRTDLVVWHGAPSAGYPRLIPNVPPNITSWDFDGEGYVVARLVMPPNTKTVAPCQITDLRTS